MTAKTEKQIFGNFYKNRKLKFAVTSSQNGDFSGDFGKICDFGGFSGGFQYRVPAKNGW